MVRETDKATKREVQKDLRELLQQNDGVYAWGRIQDEHLSEHALQWEGGVDLNEQKALVRLRPMTERTGATIDLESFSRVARQIDAPQVSPPDFRKGYDLSDADLAQLHGGAKQGTRRDAFKQATSQKRIQPGPDFSYLDKISSFWNSLPDHAQEALIAEAELQSLMDEQDEFEPRRASFLNGDNVSKEQNDEGVGYRFVVQPKTDDSEVGTIHIAVDPENDRVTIE